ncbi:hypothetical protein ACFQ21_12830 [Ohtaekwangia kribbensis]|uniref:Uncharacterized protein n=1 Tax=Ohtaekwangia kribbensis TaxID=688913 RepID=A0ABW3K245_9BACT
MEIKIDPSNCEEYIGLSYNAVIEVSGIYEAISLYEINHFTKVTWEDGIVFISVQFTKDIRQLSLRINFEQKIIEGRVLNVHKKSKRIGMRLLMGQIKASQRFGITHIKIFAFGEPEIRHEINGYITWGGYGFLMDEPYQTFFVDRMHQLGREEAYLHDLLKSKRGREIWELNGFSWQGTFTIAPNSVSMRVLEEKLNSLKKDKNV